MDYGDEVRMETNMTKKLKLMKQIDDRLTNRMCNDVFDFGGKN